MQVQYFVITSTAAFSSLLSETHWATHLASSDPAKAAVLPNIEAVNSKAAASDLVGIGASKC
jgi:hypothetical protein